ncbi:MAG: zinc ribbon domain-containing protein [Rubrivivax sp.]|nr:zinc ribbon domain-containing protein [Pyrinomonadaceae bacterium]
MFCPQCGQQQASSEVRFCSRCGFQLGAVTGLLSTGGIPSANVEQGIAVGDTPRRKGARLGGKLILFGIFLIPALAIMSAIVGSPEELALVGLILFLAGLLRLIYAFIFEDGPFRRQKQPTAYAMPVAPNLFTPPPVSALPPSGMQATAYVPPRANTGEIVYRPSVTEGTTRLLDNERESARALDRDS